MGVAGVVVLLPLFGAGGVVALAVAPHTIAPDGNVLHEPVGTDDTQTGSPLTVPQLEPMGGAHDVVLVESTKHGLPLPPVYVGATLVDANTLQALPVAVAVVIHRWPFAVSM